jgi:hypothetical protein
MCVDVYVNLFLSYTCVCVCVCTHTHTHTHTHIDLTEKVRGGMGTRREGMGRNEELEERKDYFCIFYIIMWNGDSGVLREGQISYHHPLGVHLHPLVCQRSKA